MKTALLALLPLAAAACADPPTTSLRHELMLSTPTLLVVNATCSPGPCTTFAVRGWESVFVVPGQPPAGFLHIGDVTSASACLRFPDSVLFTATEVDSTGHPLHTDSTYWTPQNSVRLSALAPGAIFPFAFADSAIVPASSPGWRVTFPGGEIAPAAPCQP